MATTTQCAATCRRRLTRATGHPARSVLPSLVYSIVIVLLLDVRTSQSSELPPEGDEVGERKTFTSSELINTRFSHKTSDDLYMDPCKAAGFLVDIALTQDEVEAVRRAATDDGSDDDDDDGDGDDDGDLSERNLHSLLADNSSESAGEPRWENNDDVAGVDTVIITSGSHLVWEDGGDDVTGENEAAVAAAGGKGKRKHKHKHKHGRRRRKHRHRSRDTKMPKNVARAQHKRRDRHHQMSPPSSERVRRHRSQKWRRRHRRRRAREGTFATRGREKRAATARAERIWDYGVIPYEIEANFSGEHRALFKRAMRHWENYTCVQFVERTAEDPNYIVFTERPCGCCSFVGKRGSGGQAISIGKNCDKFGIVVHELGHVIGFWHEHTRPDRDGNVEIFTVNIMPGQEYNFNKLGPSDVDSLGEQYDFASIMHYARNTFSKEPMLDTILPRLKTGELDRPAIGQRVRLSEGDIRQANLLYQCHACGRTMQASTGNFTSPVGLSAPIVCQWRISATMGETIVLAITRLDLPRDCSDAYLEIRDGYWKKSPLLARFCGTDVPQTLTSLTNRLLIDYHTSKSISGFDGFEASYEAVCGGEIMADEGALQSPNYPDDYTPDKHCVWKITVAVGSQVALKFQSFFVESHDDCLYDYVEIRDGHEDDSELLGKFCGYDVPEDVTSSGNQMMIVFNSDPTVEKGGFSADFLTEKDECAQGDHGCQHACVNTLGSYRCECRIGFELHSDGRRCEDACGGVISADNGTIVSPSFPDLYPPVKNCVWEIVAKQQFRITLNFTHFDLEGNNQDCEYDWVEVISELSPDSTSRSKDGSVSLHGVYCGSVLPDVVTSVSNRLRVEFNSDKSVQKSGFAAVFFIDMDECAIDNGGCQHVCKNTIGSYACECHNGYTLHADGHGCKEGGCHHRITAPTGEISSPNWPNYYQSRKDCEWYLVTTPGHRVKLAFGFFEMEPHQECAYDHITLYDGNATAAQTLGRFCGSKIPHPIVSSGNRLLVTFHSDASVQRRGFLARHVSVCGGQLVAAPSLRQLFSHAKYGDQTYDSREECDWLLIAASPETGVRLKFLSFELEDEKKCLYDYIEVYDGWDDSGPLLGKHCGTNIPPEYTSSQQVLYIRLRSDDTVNAKGFAAVYWLTERVDQPIDLIS